MNQQSNDQLVRSLEDLVANAENGARLPTIRELMRRFGVGQVTVQDALSRLKEKGLISSQVGRGSYVTKAENILGAPSDGTALAHQRHQSVLILSNSSMNERCSRVQNRILERMQEQQGHVMQLSYSDTDHLLHILRTIPTFDAVILQSHYEAIPVRLLALLKEKARAVVVDGLTVSGVDIDRVGIDWEESLELALDHLVDTGANRFCLLSLASISQPLLGARRYFERITNWHGNSIETHSLTLEGIVYPTQNAESAVQDALAKLDEDDFAPDALIFLGISDGRGIQEALRSQGLSVPDDIQVVVLGHTDVPTEHLDFFTMAGGSSSDGAEKLLDTAEMRMNGAIGDPVVTHLPSRLRIQKSTRTFT